MARARLASLTLSVLFVGCTVATGAPDEGCFDEADHPVACEALDDADEAIAASPAPLAIAPAESTAGEIDDGIDFPFDALPPGDELSLESGSMPKTASGAPDTAIAPGPTDHAELRKTIPIGRTPGATRFVVMRLGPHDLPNLKLGDVLRAAAEIQVTTRCDIGQVGPGCGYAPHVRMQLVLSSRPDATHANGKDTIALSDVKSFDCSKDDHHCVKTIDFQDASKTLTAASAPCVASGSCHVNFVMWAYAGDARSGGQDKLILGANEGNYLDNHAVEQDRGRIMAVRERDVTAADKTLRVTKHTVDSGAIGLGSDGSWNRVYAHALNGGNDLKAGQVFRVWTEVDASADHRVNLSLLFFVTKNRGDKNGGGCDAIAPSQISEHNGTNCSPGNDCHLRKVAVFEVKKDVKGPVYVNVAASTEVPGPGYAHTTIHDTGFVRSIRYAR